MEIRSTLVAAFATVLLAAPAAAQPYTIVTVAGGGIPHHVPVNTATFESGLGLIAMDRAGNFYLGYNYNLLRLDGTTGRLTNFAGTGIPGASGDNGPATLARIERVTGLAVDSNGDVYISYFRQHRIRKVSNGIITTIAGTGVGGFSGDGGLATAAQLNEPSAMAVDATGALYFTDSKNHRVRKIANGVITTIAGNGAGGFSGDNGPATAAQLSSPRALALDSSGAIYISDGYPARIRKIANGVIQTIAGGYAGGIPGRISGTPAIGAYVSPSVITVDAGGTLYFSEENEGRVRKISNGVITLIAGNGAIGPLGAGGPATEVPLSSPRGIVLDTAGSLRIIATSESALCLLSNGILSPISIPNSYALMGDRGPATGAQIGLPFGIAMDSEGGFYVADGAGGRVLHVSNGIVTAVAGSGSGDYTPYSGPALSAGIYPSGVTVDSAGAIYFSESLNGRVGKVANGTLTRFAGIGRVYVPGGGVGSTVPPQPPVLDNSPAIAAGLELPSGIATGRSGEIYIGDWGRVYAVSNGLIRTVAGTGTGGQSGEGISARLAQFGLVYAVAVDTAGNLYIADSARIRRVSNGIITTVAGNGQAGYSGDGGPATQARLNFPTGVAVDAAGNVYISDTRNNRIRKVTNGVITTIAGADNYGLSDDYQPSLQASFGQPTAIAVDAAGVVYFGDTQNRRVRALLPAGYSCNFTVSPRRINAPAQGGEFPVTIERVGPCPWRVAGLPDWVSTLDARTAGRAITLPLAIAPGTGSSRSATISIADTAIEIAQSNVPSISLGAIVNAASARPGVAPGSIATAYGKFLVDGLFTAAGGQLPNTLGSLSMQFGGTLPAPLIAVSGTQVNFQVPWELAGSADPPVTVTGSTGTSTSIALNLTPYSPGIFTVNAQGTGQGAILDTNYRLVDASNPATAGATVIQIYCTGLGAVTNRPPTGSPALSDPLSRTLATPQVRVGGVRATVQFSGLAPGAVGGYQVNVTVPAGSSKGSAVPVEIEIDGKVSNVATIAVR